MIRIAEFFQPDQESLIRLVKQCGVNDVVGSMDWSEGLEVPKERLPWSMDKLATQKKRYEETGFYLAALENRPPMEKVKLGIEGRDQEIEQVIELISNMGKLEIPVWCYEWMPIFNWIRTTTNLPSRGGALVTQFRLEDVTDPYENEYSLTEEKLWDNLKYFLDAVVPEAESAGVKLAMHPDDPPIPLVKGTPRIMYSIDNFQQLLDLHPSEMSGIALCQGNFTLMTDDLPGVIRKFGKQQKIFFVHFRDVQGQATDFVETFHDDGKTDMVACMQAYKEVGYNGICRPDHVPTMGEDSNQNFGYSEIGRLFAIGYLKGLRQAVYA
ncbi:MAG: mannonate dehydratase [Deltaproteobacteria bacterium]|nr:mannonate dehydratase [Deltaproteobacteria bacterium]